MRWLFGYGVRRRLMTGLMPLLLVVLGGYLLFHTVQGDHGLVGYMMLSKQKDRLGQELAELRAERKSLEHRVSLLRRGKPDPDLLEERARSVLNFGHEGDWVILNSAPGPDTQDTN